MNREDVLAMTTFAEVNSAIRNPDPKISSSMKSLLADREVAVHVQKLINNRVQEQAEREAAIAATASTIPPTTEELAAEAAAVAAEQPPADAPVVPPSADVLAAEDNAYKAEGVTVFRDATGHIIRLVQEYQVRAEDGSAIGRPTHLEAKSPLELLSKQRVAHEEAVRFGYRMKKHKMTQKAEPKTILTAEQLKAAAEQVLQEKDVSKAEDVVRAAIESQFTKREQELRAKEAQAEGKAISNEFMRNHLHDYNPCTANQKAIGEYFVEQKLEFDLDNLEIAFADLMEQGKLVKVSKPFQTSVEAAVNPAPTTASTSAATEGTPPVAQPVAAQTPVAAPPQPNTPAVEATATTPAAPANQAPAARRPGLNGSLPPGSFSAQRPVPVDPAQARKQFMQNLNKMSAEEIRRKKNNDPQFVAQLTTYGIKLQ